MTFTDVAVDITREDWERMRPVQKELYKTVTLQNYWNMVSLGERRLRPALLPAYAPESFSPQLSKMVRPRGERACPFRHRNGKVLLPFPKGKVSK